MTKFLDPPLVTNKVRRLDRIGFGPLFSTTVFHFDVGSASFQSSPWLCLLKKLELETLFFYLSSCFSCLSQRFFRRRVASLSSGEINIRGKADVVGVKQPVVDDPTMRTELFSPWQETVVVDLEEYTSMANELADIKSKLVDLQTLLLDLPDQEHARLNNLTATPLWDLKRDIVLLREELQEKNMVIRTLKNELRVATGKTRERADSSSSSIASSSSSTSPNPRVKKASCSNVATQTDRPRVVAVGNGLSPGSDDIQVVSSKLKKTAPCGSGSGLCIPVLSRPFTAAPMNN